MLSFAPTEVIPFSPENRFLNLPKLGVDIHAPITSIEQTGTPDATSPQLQNDFLVLPKHEVDLPMPTTSVEQLLAQMYKYEDFRASWLSKQKSKLAMAVTAASIGLTLVDSPLSETKDRIVEASTWMAPSLLAGEIVWIGGGAMMLAAIGSKVKNPFKIKKMIPEIADKANNSFLFRAGYLINTTAAIAEFGISTVGVTTEFPVSSWGLSSFGFIDLAATYFVRRAIRRGIKNNVADEPSTAQATTQ